MTTQVIFLFSDNKVITGATEAVPVELTPLSSASGG
jgi:hypothetical protein